MYRIALVAALAAPVVFGPPMAAAQVTDIVADVGARGLGTTVAQSGNTTTIDGGTIAGANLFHSFASFSLATGSTAQWVRSGGGAASVRNVISRVTGGAPSQIGGALDSTAFAGADFFFVNPAGIVFGQGAQVNVAGAAHFSTASSLAFGDGASFSIATPGGAVLSVAAPESFGFVGGEADIAVEGVAGTFAGTPGGLTLSAANIGMTGGVLFAPGVDLTAVGDEAGTVRLADPLAGARTGTVAISGGLVTTRPGPSGGALRIAAGVVRLEDARLFSDTDSAARGGDVRITANALQGTGSSITALTRGVGAGGALAISAATIDLERVVVASVGSSSGAAGAITVEARTALNGVNSQFQSSALGGGASGGVNIAAPSIDLVDSIIFNSVLAGSPPTQVNLSGRTISLSGGLYGGGGGFDTDTGDLAIVATQRIDLEGVSLAASTYSSGRAGSIRIAAPEIFMTDGLVNSDVYGAGSTGFITFEAARLVLDRAQIRSQAQGAASDRAGAIRLTTTGDLTLRNSSVTSETGPFSAANGGAIILSGANVTLDDNRVQADTASSGKGGEVSITAKNLLVRNGVVSSDSRGVGDAGGVLIVSDTLLVDQNAKISSDARGVSGDDVLNSGDGGSVKIKAGTMTLVDGASVTSKAVAANGNAGAVVVLADKLYISDAFISSGTDTPGNAGAVQVEAREIELDGQGRDFFTNISSDTYGLGDAGGVQIKADKIVVKNNAFISSQARGNGNAGGVVISGKSLSVLDGAHVDSDSYGVGNGGNVSVFVDEVLVKGLPESGDITYISADAISGGDAGTVTIEAKKLEVKSGGFVSSDTYDFGRAGDVLVKADSLLLEGGSLRTRTYSNGDAGNIIVRAGQLTMTKGGTVDSTAYPRADARAGFIKITANDVFMTGESVISTASANPKAAGFIEVTAPTIRLTGSGTQITSANVTGDGKDGGLQGSGDAGAIRLSGELIRISEGASVTSNSFAGAAGSIDIVMSETTRQPGVLYLDGVDAPGVIATSSGAGTGGKIIVSRPLAVISNGGSVLALGQQRGANVLIDSRYFIRSSDRTDIQDVRGEFKLVAGVYDVSSGTVTRDLSVLDASKVLQGQCPAARASGEVSQLITRPVGPYAAERAPGTRRVVTPGGGGCS